MYLLISLADVIQIHPSDFSKPSARAVEDYINTKYADKVIHKVGLCLGFHSIISASEGLIGHGSGLVSVNVDFRLIIFRPFKGEIVQGTITHSTPRAGVYLSQDFFEDIVIPPETLFDNTEWGKDDQGTKAFIWRSKDEETADVNEYFFDRAETCLYRVEEEQWRDLSPQMQKPSQDFVVDEVDSEGVLRKTPYLIRGSMMLSGLGPTLWWTGEGIGGDDEADGKDGDMEDVTNGDGDTNGDAKPVLET